MFTQFRSKLTEALPLAIAEQRYFRRYFSILYILAQKRGEELVDAEFFAAFAEMQVEAGIEVMIKIALAPAQRFQVQQEFRAGEALGVEPCRGVQQQTRFFTEAAVGSTKAAFRSRMSAISAAVPWPRRAAAAAQRGGGQLHGQAAGMARLQAFRRSATRSRGPRLLRPHSSAAPRIEGRHLARFITIPSTEHGGDEHLAGHPGGGQPGEHVLHVGDIIVDEQRRRGGEGIERVLAFLEQREIVGDGEIKVAFLPPAPGRAAACR